MPAARCDMQLTCRDSNGGLTPVFKSPQRWHSAASTYSELRSMSDVLLHLTEQRHAKGAV